MARNIHPHGYWLDNKRHNFDKALAANIAALVNGGSVLDLGCGDGRYVRFLNSAGCKAIGVDGNPLTATYGPECMVADLTTPLDYGLHDWVICLEVGEHIPEQHSDVLFDNIVRHVRHSLILSWAVPRQLGHGHVNTRPNAWVIDKVMSFGFSYDEKAARNLRKKSTLPWFKHTVMVFHKVAAVGM